MKKKRVLIFAVIFIVLLVIQTLSVSFNMPLGCDDRCQYAKAQTVTQDSGQKSVEQTFDEAVEEIIESKKAIGATATLVKDGKATLQKGYGYSDKTKNLPVDPNVSGFRIGSISKTFVAIAALIAEEDGKLDLNTDITKYLEEDFPRFKYPVTMNQLLTHTAGFEDLITGIAVKDKRDIEPLSEVIRKYKPEQIVKSGEVISYSNYGIALAAYVIEKVTGIDFAEYCKEKIFIPLGMYQTSFNYERNNLVYSKAFLPNGKETSEPYINIYPEGSVIPTARDMSKYIKWLLSNQESILKNETKEKLFNQHFTMADELNGIGYTWNIKSRNGTKYYEKKGETVNFYSRIVLYPSCNTGLFFSFNTYVPEDDINTIVDKVTDNLLGKQENPVQKQSATMKIEGNYINFRSSFKTAEKFLSYIILDKMIEITGTLSSGYKLNDKRITHIGNNVYDTPIGTIKFIEKNGKTFLATNFSQTYVKINILQSVKVTVATLILFALSTLFYSICMLINIIRKKNIPKVLAVMSLVQLFAFMILCAVLMIGLINYSVLFYDIFIKISAWIILAATVFNIVYLLITGIKSYKIKHVKYLFVHNIISVAFCLVMFNLNVL